MKPGAIFGSYEWCVTPRYDPGDPEHRAIKADIEAGDALPDLVPFDVVLDQFHEQSERRDARDVATVFIANLVGHEANLLPLQQLAFGFGGTPFHVRRVTRGLR